MTRRGSSTRAPASGRWRRSTTYGPATPVWSWSKSLNRPPDLQAYLIAAIIAAWPAVALVGSYELLMSLIRSGSDVRRREPDAVHASGDGQLGNLRGLASHWPDLQGGLSASDRGRPLLTGVNGPLMAGGREEPELPAFCFRPEEGTARYRGLSPVMTRPGVRLLGHDW